MTRVCSELPGPKMANIVEGGETPDLSNAELHQIGYAIAAYPLSLMAAAMQAMVTSLRAMKQDQRPGQMDFVELRQRIGFDEYYAASETYASSHRS